MTGGVFGPNRFHFYEIKQDDETFGREGLAPMIPRRPRMPNHTPPEVGTQVLGLTEKHPTFSAPGRPVEHILRDIGREYCIRQLHYPDALFLSSSQIGHRNTMVHAPYTGGFCERFRPTVREELFTQAFKKTFSMSHAQLQVVVVQSCSLELFLASAQYLVPSSPRLYIPKYLAMMFFWISEVPE